MYGLLIFQFCKDTIYFPNKRKIFRSLQMTAFINQNVAYQLFIYTTHALRPHSPRTAYLKRHNAWLASNLLQPKWRNFERLLYFCTPFTIFDSSYNRLIISKPSASPVDWAPQLLPPARTQQASLPHGTLLACLTPTQFLIHFMLLYFFHHLPLGRG